MMVKAEHSTFQLSGVKTFLVQSQATRRSINYPANPVPKPARKEAMTRIVGINSNPGCGLEIQSQAQRQRARARQFVVKVERV